MTLFPELGPPVRKQNTTFRDNMKMPFHRWFKYSAGFSADWVTQRLRRNPEMQTIFDPFAGSGTTLIAASLMGRKSIGFESHPFVSRIASTKIGALNLNPLILAARVSNFLDIIPLCEPSPEILMNELMVRIFDANNLMRIAKIRTAVDQLSTDNYDSVIWLAVGAILRSSSHSGTASWQYVLPNHTKLRVSNAIEALELKLRQYMGDIEGVININLGSADLLRHDSRIPYPEGNGSCDTIITSPPYANNFDYADATRIEMTFFGDVSRWGDLQSVVREHIVRSSTQHVSPYKRLAEQILLSPEIQPIADELNNIVDLLKEQKFIKPGKKDYDAMIIFYLYDMAKCMQNSRSMLREGGKGYFVIGDSAPYGVYVPVDRFLGELAISAGFERWTFVKERDRNIKWKNRKHTVPLKEGFLILRG